VGNFSEGLASYREGSKRGFINKRGEVVIKPEYVTAVTFTNGLSIVELGGGEWGYIDRKGRFVWKSSE